MNWQPISTAPKDGTWVLLRGGSDPEWYGNVPINQPVIAAFWKPLANPVRVFDESDDPSKDTWIDGHWLYAWWEGGWRSEWVNPIEWMPIPE